MKIDRLVGIVFILERFFKYRSTYLLVEKFPPSILFLASQVQYYQQPRPFYRDGPPSAPYHNFDLLPLTTKRCFCRLITVNSCREATGSINYTRSWLVSMTAAMFRQGSRRPDGIVILLFPFRFAVSCGDRVLFKSNVAENSSSHAERWRTRTSIQIRRILKNL